MKIRAKEVERESQSKDKGTRSELQRASRRVDRVCVCVCACACEMEVSAFV